MPTKKKSSGVKLRMREHVLDPHQQAELNREKRALAKSQKEIDGKYRREYVLQLQDRKQGTVNFAAERVGQDMRDLVAAVSRELVKGHSESLAILLRNRSDTYRRRLVVHVVHAVDDAIGKFDVKKATRESAAAMHKMFVEALQRIAREAMDRAIKRDKKYIEATFRKRFAGLKKIIAKRVPVAKDWLRS